MLYQDIMRSPVPKEHATLKVNSEHKVLSRGKYAVITCTSS